MNYKRIIENKTKNENFVLEVRYVPIEENIELNFEFSNAGALLERNLLKVLDSEDNNLHPDTIRFIHPIKTNRQKVTISDKKPFFYKIEGELIKEGNFIRLELKSVDYLLKPSQKYGLELRDSENSSNRVYLEI